MPRYVIRTYSNHAQKQLLERPEVSINEITETLEAPDRFYVGKKQRLVCERNVSHKLCLRVIYTELPYELYGMRAHIITFYKMDKERAERQAVNENS